MRNAAHRVAILLPLPLGEQGKGMLRKVGYAPTPNPPITYEYIRRNTLRYSALRASVLRPMLGSRVSGLPGGPVAVIIKVLSRKMLNFGLCGMDENAMRLRIRIPGRDSGH